MLLVLFKSALDCYSRWKMGAEQIVYLFIIIITHRFRSRKKKNYPNFYIEYYQPLTTIVIITSSIFTITIIIVLLAKCHSTLWYSLFTPSTAYHPLLPHSPPIYRDKMAKHPPHPSPPLPPTFCHSRAASSSSLMLWVTRDTTTVTISVRKKLVHDPANTV